MKTKSSEITKVFVIIVSLIALAVNTVIVVNGFNGITKKIDEVETKVDDLTTRVDNLEQELEEHKKSFDIAYEYYQKDMAQLNSKLDNVNSGIQRNQTTVNSQYRKTVQMEQTYSSLLEEEKKRHLDTAEHDSENDKLANEAKSLFAKKEYVKAYEIFNNILQDDLSNNEIRMYRMLSLFNINKLDSSNYAEILQNIKILRENGSTDPRLDEVEEFIKGENE